MADVFTRLAQRGRSGDGELAPRPRTPFEPRTGEDPDLSEVVVESAVSPTPGMGLSSASRSGVEDSPVRTATSSDSPGPHPIRHLEGRPRTELTGSSTMRPRREPAAEPDSGLRPARHPLMESAEAVTASAGAASEGRQPHADQRIRPMLPSAPTTVTTTSAAVIAPRPNVPDAVRERAAATSQPAEPAVQISIGRIEIRAVAPPAPSATPDRSAAPPAAASAAAGVSLSAYLRGDDGRPI